MIVAPTTGRRPKIFFGWYVVIAAALMNTYGSGVWFYGFPIFYKVLLDTFGWTAAGGALIVSLSRLEGGLEGPIIGWLIDKYGPRRLAIIGGAMFGVGLMAMSQISEGGYVIGPLHISAFASFTILYAGWMAIGHNTGFSHAGQAAVNAWFIRKRSRAFTIFALGAGSSGFTVMLLGWLVDSFGWRTAAFVAGLGIFAIVIPLSLVLRHRPEQYGYLPDGEDPHATSLAVTGETNANETAAEGTHSADEGLGAPRPASARWPEYDFSVKATLATLAFWMLILGTSARALAMTSVILHEVKYLTDVRGFALTEASGALGATVAVSMIGRIGFGVLGDYVEKRYIMIVCFLLQALGIYILSVATTMNQVWLFVFVYGIAYGGAIPVYSAMVGEFFGRRNFATIRGFMQLFQVPTTIVGPVFAGWVYDTTGGYQSAFVTFIVALLVGTVFLFFTRRPRPPVGAGQAPPPLAGVPSRG